MEPNTVRKYRYLITILGVLVILSSAYWFYFQPPLLWLTVLVGINAALVGAWLIMARLTTRLKIKRGDNLQEIGVTEEMLEEALREGQTKLNRLVALQKTIKKPGVVANISAIATTVKKIQAEIMKDPTDLLRVQRFWAYYLDSTLSIVERYASLSKEDHPNADLQKSLTKVEDGLELIKGAFVKFYQNLLNNDALELDTDIEVMMKTIRMEG